MSKKYRTNVRDTSERQILYNGAALPVDAYYVLHAECPGPNRTVAVARAAKVVWEDGSKRKAVFSAVASPGRCVKGPERTAAAQRLPFALSPPPSLLVFPMSYSYHNNQTPVHQTQGRDEYYDPYSETQRAPHATYDQGGYRDDYYDASARPVINNAVPREKDQPFNSAEFNKEAHTAQCVHYRQRQETCSYGLVQLKFTEIPICEG